LFTILKLFVIKPICFTLGVVHGGIETARGNTMRLLSLSALAVVCTLLISLPLSRKVFADKVTQRIQRLGDPHFIDREKASENLIRVGPSAITALENHGLSHRLREVRFRSQAILAQLQ